MRKLLTRYGWLFWTISIVLHPFFSSAEPPKLSAFSQQGLLEGKQLFSLLHDHYGFLWIGCSDGLLRFDGYQLESFHANFQDSTQLQNDYINKIYEDTKGRIWVLSQDYVSFYEYQTNQFRSFPIPHQTIASAVDIIEDQDGKIWITTVEGYASLSPKKGWENYTPLAASINDGFDGVPCFYVTEKGKVWIATGRGEDIATTIHVQVKTTSRHLGLKSGIAAISNYLTQFKTELQAIYPSVYQDANGHFWFYGKNYPLRFWDGNETTQPEIMVKQTCWQVVEDSEKNLWFAHGRNINTLSKNNIPIQTHRIYALENDKADTWPHVYTISGQANGDVWLGGSSNLHHYTRGRNGAFRLEQKWDQTTLKKTGIKGISIFDLYTDQEGTLWAGTRWGLHRYDAKEERFEHLDYPFVSQPTTKNNQSFIYHIERANGAILIGTKTGIYQLDEVKKCFQALFEQGTSVFNFHVDTDGSIWAGTGTGLYHIQGKNVTHYQKNTQQNGLNDNTVMHIRAEGDRYLWLSTLGGGLNQFDKETKQVTVFNQQANILSNNTYGTMMYQEQVWASTISGLSILPKNATTFINISQENGFPLQELNQGAFFQAEEGTLFFGGKGAWAYFHPDSLPLNQQAYLPYAIHWNINYEPLQEVDKWQIFGEQATIDANELNFYPEHRVISFELSTLHAQMGNQIRYAFMLEGYDEKWVERSSQQRQITYTNLPQGIYTLKLKASNEFGVWNEAIREIKIHVYPPFQETLWFKLLLLLLVGSGIGALAYFWQRQQYAKKIRQMETQHQLQLERQRISRDLHDNIGAQLTAIATKLDIAAYQAGKNPSAGMQERIEQVGDEARMTINLLRDTIWTIQQDHVSLGEFVMKTKGYLERQLANCLAYEVLTSYEASAMDIVLEANQVLNLFRIFQEVVQNTLKHAQATKLVVDFDVKQQQIIMMLQDDGKGMDLATAQLKEGHYGLKNLQQRAEEINAVIQFESSENQGVKVIVRLGFDLKEKPN